MVAPSDLDLVDETQPEIISVIYACESLWREEVLMKMRTRYGNLVYNDL